MNTAKLRKKYNRKRVFKAVSYLLGFPLFLLLTFVGSMVFFKTDGFASTKLTGLIAVIVLWAATTVVQIVVSIFSKKLNTRTLASVLAVVILVVGGAVVFDYAYANKKIEKLQEKYALNTGVKIQNYNKMINTYAGFFPEDFSAIGSTETARYNAEISRFEAVYNVSFKGSVYGDNNTDGSEYYYDKKAGAYLSENGMYADGYVFGVKQAVDILVDYHTAPIRYFIKNSSRLETRLRDVMQKEKSRRADPDNPSPPTVQLTGMQRDEIKMFAAIDLETVSVFPTPSELLAFGLNKIMEDDYKTALKSSAVDREYKNQEGYDEAYGLDGTAYNYMFNEVRLNALVASIGKGLVAFSDKVGTNALIINALKGIVPGEVSGNTVLDIINALADVSYGRNDYLNLRASDIVEILANIDLGDGQKIDVSILESLGLGISPEDIGLSEGDAFTVNSLLKLLELFVYYQSPSIRPKFTFIEDEDIVTYARAKYYAITHGGNIGSVLIGDRVGAVTMMTSGYGSEYAFTLTELYQLQADLEYIPSLFPLFAVRRYAYVCGGLTAMSFIFYYNKKKQEDEIFNDIQDSRGGY